MAKRPLPQPMTRRAMLSASVTAGVTAGAMQLLPPAPAHAASASPHNPIFEVRLFGAKGDGTTDDTPAFTTALNLAAAAGGGTVSVSQGHYLIAGHLNIPPGVTVSGTFGYVPSCNGLRDAGLPKPGDVGTVLLATADRGHEAGEPFITLNTDSTLAKLTIYYPAQVPGAAPVPYPWVIAMRGKNPAVLDVELLNPYQGIDASQNERHNIRNVTGQPLRRGIWVDAVYDIGRIENVHFNPWWNWDEPIKRWMAEHGEAFIFARADWEYVLNTFVLGYRAGYRFTQSTNGACNGNFLGIGADVCTHAVEVLHTQLDGGLQITNGEFVARGETDTRGVVVEPSNEGVVSLCNCSFWGDFDRIVSARGAGPVMLNACTFAGWDRQRNGEPALVFDGPATTVANCQFFRAGGPNAVRVTAASPCAVIHGNTASGAKFSVDVPPDAAKYAVGMNVCTGRASP